MSKVCLLQGNEACALGAIAAGAGFFAGYPITPSTEIEELIAERFPSLGRKFIQMEDEIASLAAVIGAACVGEKAFTATSGPGFSLMQELISYAANVEIPVVIVDVMRPGPATGLPTLSSQGDIQQARWGAHGDHSIIALSPSSVKEAYHETINAFHLAKKYRTPVVILMDEEIGHLRESMVLPGEEEWEPRYRNISFDEEEKADGVSPFVPFGQGMRYHLTGLTHGEKGFYSRDPQAVDHFIRRINDKIENEVTTICRFQEIDTEDCEVLIIAYGSVARSAEEAIEILQKKNIHAGLLRPITLWPFNEQKIKEISQGKKLVLMAEMNLGQYYREVRRAVSDEVPVLSLSRVDSELIEPQQIVAMIEEALQGGIA